MARRLREDAQEIDQSLEEFMRNRLDCIEAQRRALDEYNEEIARISEEHNGVMGGPEPEEERTDHNLNRHLNLSKKADYQPEDDIDYDASGWGGEDGGSSRFDTNYVDVPKKEYFDKGLKPKPPVPSREAKEKMREAVFNMLEQSQTEEMQLQLEYERKREQVGAFRAEYLAEGLFTVQKDNFARLKGMISDYQPQGFGKAWGNDPDYVRMSEELKTRLTKLDAEEVAASDEIHAAGGGGKSHGGKGKKKKKGGKHKGADEIGISYSHSHSGYLTEIGQHAHRHSDIPSHIQPSI